MSDDPVRREPELLTITEAAELLRAPVATLRYWRHLGTGPRSFRLGRRVLYRSDDLRSWIDAQRGRGTVGSGQREGQQARTSALTSSDSSGMLRSELFRPKN